MTGIACLNAQQWCLDTVTVIDPASTAAVQILNLDGFLTAWFEMDLAYAVIRRS